MDSLYNMPDVYIAFREYNPIDPSTPGPEQKWKLFGQWTVIQYLLQTVPAIVTTDTSPVNTSTTAAHTITVPTQVTVFYVYGADGKVKLTLPEHITFLNYKTI